MKSQWLDLSLGLLSIFTPHLCFTLNHLNHKGKQVWSDSSAAFWVVGFPWIWVCSVPDRIYHLYNARCFIADKVYQLAMLENHPTAPIDNKIFGQK